MKPVEINIRRVRFAVVRAESEIHDYGAHSRVARRLHVNFGIAHHRHLLCRNVELVQNLLRAKWIGFFRFKTVTALNAAEILRDPQSF